VEYTVNVGSEDYGSQQMDTRTKSEACDFYMNADDSICFAVYLYPIRS